MPYTINAQCPCCTKNASGLDKVKELFGLRTMSDGKEIPQSYCKDCRSKKCSPNNKKCN